jgi:hypothetical protein
LALSAVCSLLGSEASAETVEEFYRGKTITQQC